MPTLTKPKTPATTAVVMQITSPTPLPAAELRRRAEAALLQAGLEAKPAPKTKKAARPRLTAREKREAAIASLYATLGRMEANASAGPPMTEEEIVEECRIVRRERYERAQAEKK